LLSEDADTIARLRQESQKRGVSGRRLIFGAHLPLEDHLSRHQAADLFLDTLPCNAHTTASDALWAGLPVLTLIGESFAGRVCASLLAAVGLDEFITSSSEEYEALAVALARDPRRLDEVKQRLNVSRLKSPLFDATLFARNLEAAFEQMIELSRVGRPPQDIELLTSSIASTERTSN
jgi:protein O-GlcNAc transferase